MGILKGGVQIKTGQVRVVYSEDPDVSLPPKLAGCGWVPEAEAESVKPGADIVTVQALSPAQLARYRDVHRSHGSGTAMRDALLMGVTEAVFRDESGKRVTVRGKGTATYVDALVQQAVVVAELLSEVVHRLSRGEGIEAGYPLARLLLDAEEPVPQGSEVPTDGDTFRGEPA